MNQNWLKGKKTYLTVIASIVGVLIAVANGEKDAAAAVGAIGLLLAQAFLRQGSKADADKVIEHVNASNSSSV